jgi:hypothetical protein
MEHARCGETLGLELDLGSLPPFGEQDRLVCQTNTVPIGLLDVSIDDDRAWDAGLGAEPDRVGRTLLKIVHHLYKPRVPLHCVHRSDIDPVDVRFDATNARSWYARSRSRVATGLLLTAPGIPPLFMGKEFLEDKPWSDSDKTA